MVMSAKLYDRWAVSSVKDALSIWRSVFISGVRQCGKTTLAHQAMPDGDFRTLDDSALFDVAEFPSVIKGFDKTAILEVAFRGGNPRLEA